MSGIECWQLKRQQHILSINMSQEGGAPQLRPMLCEQRTLSQPDGSATFSHGLTSVMAAVYGPTEVRVAREQADRAVLEVVFKPKVGVGSCAARGMEEVIRGICESVILTSLHPRTAFTVVIQELHNDGSLLACCVNAVCSALLDACVPMIFPFAAVACSIDPDGQLTLDPNKKSELASVSSATFVFDSKEQNVLTASAAGNMTNEQFQTCIAACRQASKSIFTLYRESYAKRAAVLWKYLMHQILHIQFLCSACSIVVFEWCLCCPTVLNSRLLAINSFYVYLHSFIFRHQ